MVFVYLFFGGGGCGFACLFVFNRNALMHRIKRHCASCGAYKTDIFLSLAGGDWQAWKKGMNKGAVSEIHLIFNSSCQTGMQTRVQEKWDNVEVEPVCAFVTGTVDGTGTGRVDGRDLWVQGWRAAPAGLNLTNSLSKSMERSQSGTLPEVSVWTGEADYRSYYKRCTKTSPKQNQTFYSCKV